MPEPLRPRKVSALGFRALMIRIGFGGMLYYGYNKEPPK